MYSYNISFYFGIDFYGFEKAVNYVGELFHMCFFRRRRVV